MNSREAVYTACMMLFGVMCPSPLAYAARPERERNSACQIGNGTFPPVASSISRAVLASGNRLPLRYRLMVTCVRPIAAASSRSPIEPSLKKADRVSW